ncbi:amino acid ABC transporter ATP-binding protein [Campylobacter sp. 19-13652]|uniref:amino acid ABC transporter ATP-binding protein n=1 Tax=Campylobacter sp. 19-13652 TaxID=2840180 RepID=UPI001C78673A|nr:amino acid ABC transporter ATP-binding protein [Campylobacter sp. 19-13652]BCX78733.1 polar amino acid ABC transporter ATP-binding protein [Campylobacter sp. 19-13652]
MIKIKNLSKKFENNVVLNDINLDVKDGKIIAILGPSGSGKSTLLRCINLLERPYAGSIKIDDLEIDYANVNQKQTKELRLKSAMVFQSYNLFANKNAIENVAEALIITRSFSKQDAFNVAQQKLAQMGLEHKQNAYPHELSGGQQQRVAIARALAINPKVMLFDEPTSALDVELVAEVLDAIKSIKDRTMLIVTHELEFAREIADEIVFLAGGRIVYQGLPDEFFTLAYHENETLNNFLKRIKKGA